MGWRPLLSGGGPTAAGDKHLPTLLVVIVVVCQDLNTENGPGHIISFGEVLMRLLVEPPGGGVPSGFRKPCCEPHNSPKSETAHIQKTLLDKQKQKKYVELRK